ncbi:MAG: hypothetical protein JNM57_04790 [Cyclobacteriaceae bacterium]|nr:hypothetical protein [Cyclobacteriaceae bacterium]
MKKQFKLLLMAATLLLTANAGFAQNQSEINTLFKGNIRSSGYGAIQNKFTTINGQYANMVEAYGGWFINRKFMLGIGGGAVTNNLPVPVQDRVIGLLDLSYMYTQFGMYSEYVVSSNKTVHLVFQLFAGPGFTAQYQRYNWDDHQNYEENYNHYDENWFTVIEPGVQVEVNIFKWMRFSPGISYRFANGSNGLGLSDNDISGASINLGLKFGGF